MEDLIFRKINKYMFSLFSAIIIFFIIFTYNNKYNNNVEELKQIVEQIKSSSERSEKSREIAEKLFKEDYLNRAVAIEEMLNNIPGAITRENLQHINKLMNIESISLVDDKGIIINSSNADLIGKNMLSNDENKNFRELFNNENKKSSVDLYGKSILVNEEDSTYIGLRTDDKRYNLLQIKIGRSQLEQLINPISLKTIIKNTPTIYEKTIFLVDKKTQKISAITKNNEQCLEFNNYNNQTDFVDFLESFNQGKYTVINDQEKLLITGNLDDSIIGITIDATYIYKSVFFYILYIATVCLFIFIAIKLIMRYCINEFVLKDIYSIESVIREILSGEDSVNFSVKYNTELRYLCNLLQFWKKNYDDKSDRLTFLSQSIDQNIAIFECLNDINRSFFSDNLKSILNICDSEWAEYKVSPEKYKDYIKYLIEKYSIEENLINVNKKYIKITYFENHNSFYGIIYDKTEDILQKRKVDKAIKESEYDALTLLSNRKKIEQEAKSFFKKDEHNGVLIIFDLDNFKLVNDNEGHLEGDKVLKTFADCLKKFFRSDDIISRVGGDEFVVLMKNSIPEDLLKLKLDNLLKNVRQELKRYAQLYNISCSIGAVFIDEKMQYYGEAYKYADAGLYIAKKWGKNRYFINNELIDCMKVECEHCRKQCSRRRILFNKS